MSGSIDFPPKSDSLRNIAINQCDVKEDYTGSSGQSREHTIIFIGSKGVGKTTLIHRFLDRDEKPKPTLALDYTYGRKSGKSLVKDVCHIWELGDGTLHLPLLEAPLASLGPGGMRHLTVVLMLDLSDPQHLWFTMETLLHDLFKCIQHELGPDLQTLQNEMWSCLDKVHPDEDFMDPFPVPLIILGGKYDAFQEFDPENKKVICRCLRYVALTLGAALQFYSVKEPGLVKKAKDLLAFHGFGSPAIKSISTDYNKPLLIPAGSDSMQQIGVAGAPIRNVNKALNPTGPGAALEQWKHLFTSHYKQEVEGKYEMPEDPIQDLNYNEPTIDELRIQKDDELQTYRQLSERHEKFDDDFDSNV